MARITPYLVSFNAGEWSPELAGRVDLAKYPQSCRTLLNMVATAEGPATRRPGTRFVAATKLAAPVRLIPFQFSTEQAYIIEAGPYYFRYYKDRGRIEAPAGTPVETPTPYSLADLAALKWAQSADVLYLVHPNHQPHKLSRSSHTQWALAAASFQDGPYLDIHNGNLTMSPSASTGSVTITASAPVFVSQDAGRLIRIQHTSNGTVTWGWAVITGISSPTSAIATVKRNFGGTAASKAWRLGAWSQGTGWPAAITFHEERLIFANCLQQPQTLWASVSGDYENFAPSDAAGLTTADSAITATIADDRVNAVHWLSAGRVLTLGTSGGEFTVQASSLNEALTPDNVTIRRETTIGCADILPVRVNRAVLYIQRARRKLFEIAYQFEADGFVAPEMSLLARHLAQRGFKELAFQQEPWSVLWAVTDDGSLLGLTYLRDQEVIGWHQHQLGGHQVRVQSIAAIPGDGQDELWLAVAREGPAGPLYSIEFLEYALPSLAAEAAQCFFVDCGLSYDGPPVTSLLGLDHLEGETVQILADGAAHPSRIVQNGGITLDHPASCVHAGLPYLSRLETQSLETGGFEGAAFGKPKRISRAVVKFYQSLGGRIGYDDYHMEEILFREGGAEMNKGPALFSGDKWVLFPKGWDRSVHIMAVQDQPLPLTILAIAPSLTVMEG